MTAPARVSVDGQPVSVRDATDLRRQVADMARNASPAIGFVCIGAALDFIAGAERRAPVLGRRLKVEWAWRLARAPRRLVARCVHCGLLYLRLALRSAA